MTQHATAPADHSAVEEWAALAGQGIDHGAQPIAFEAITPGMDVARTVVTALGAGVETLRVAGISGLVLTSSRGATLTATATDRWFVLPQDPATVRQLCPSCGQEVTLVHEFSHRAPVHVTSQSRWCTTDTGPAWPVSTAA